MSVSKPYPLGFTEPKLKTLYRDLRGQGTSDAELDRGCESMDYVSLKAKAPTGVADHRIQSCELFNAVVEGSFSSSAYQRYSGETLPWIPTPENPSTQEVLGRFDRDLVRWPRETLAQSIYHWVLAGDGLGVEVEAVNPQRNFDEAAALRRADCPEFFVLLYALLSRAGFSPYPVWVQTDAYGQESQHLVTGLDLGGKTYLVDPYFGSFNAPHQTYARISLREYLGWHWINRAQDLEAKKTLEADVAYERARQIDPANPHLYYNRGRFSAHRGKIKSARKDYLEALNLDPNFHQAHFGLGELAFNAGDYRKATDHYRRAVALKPQKEEYRHMLVLSLFYRGQLGEARKEYDELLRLNPDYVHKNLDPIWVHGSKCLDLPRSNSSNGSLNFF